MGALLRYLLPPEQRIVSRRYLQLTTVYSCGGLAIERLVSDLPDVLNR